MDTPVLRWEGVIDPECLAGLRAWNTRTRAWDLLTSARGAARGTTRLSAVVDDRYIDHQQVHVMVTGEDPFADDIEPGAPDAFADPAAGKAAQLVLIAVLFPLLTLARRTPAARWVAVTLTTVIVTISLYWFLDRIPLPIGQSS
ncbi:hypothetical protein [Streptomyces sp. NPDC001292]|uniref:hypothetical protein n=1 Tax=Streptomyces sp. NPDC001292 TaxID=3364558 RepID=UPI0036958C8F